MYPNNLIRQYNEELNELEMALLKVCITEMHILKSQNQLDGKTVSEEYQFFCEKKLKNPDYIKKILQKYPELQRLIKVRLMYAQNNWKEVFENFQKDQEFLKKRILTNDFKNIKKIEALCSDSHNNGGKIFLCELEKDLKIVYKQHTLKKEIIYKNLFDYFCQNLGIKNINIRMYEGGNYGWEEYIKPKSCYTLRQVSNYFSRMGIHLFLCMLLHITDMHCENFIAVGEHPIAIDLETMPGVRNKIVIRTAEDKVNFFLKNSVLITGILPTPAWRTREASILLGALYNNKDIKLPIKLPVILDAETSNMRIGYQNISLKFPSCLPTYMGKIIEAYQYVEEICKGFKEAYNLWFKNQEEIENLIKPLWKCQTRFLLRHTQQYSMYRSASLHPELLQNTEKRKEIFKILSKNAEMKEFVEQEINSLMNLDIPLFECKADEIVPYFKTSAYEVYKARTLFMNKADLKRQIALIHLTIELSNTKKYREFYNKKNRDVSKKGILQKNIIDLIKTFEQNVFIEKNTVSWMNLYIDDTGYWKIQSVDVSLYDGIGGIAIFAAVGKNNKFWKNEILYQQIITTFEKMSQSYLCKEKKDTGLLKGIGSIVFSYVCLYQIEKKNYFLGKAREYAALLEKEYYKDNKLDLLSGNAGAIIALEKLFEIDKDERWVRLAVEIGEWLWKLRDIYDVGVGWCLPHMKRALAGLSHGNSGYILAYAALLKCTKKKEYLKRIEDIIAYENSLYSEENGNWMDLREEKGNIYTNTWCHGAPGILLSRLRLVELAEFKDDSKIYLDIERGAKALFSTEKREEMCFCHGISGNLWIMMEYIRVMGGTEAQKRKLEDMKRYLLENTAEIKKMLPQDKNNYGFMIGLAGIGFVLMKMQSDVLK